MNPKIDEHMVEVCLLKNGGENKQSVNQVFLIKLNKTKLPS